MDFNFVDTLKNHNLNLIRKTTEILQVNIGKKCNLACHHCHVESGPLRTENMDQKTLDRLLYVLNQSPSIHTVDITGGAPELNPHFKTLVIESRKMKKNVIDRCNLTVLFEDGMSEIPEFLRDHQVQIVASLPCYSRENVEKQRGRGVFNKSVEALKILNNLGYGKENSDLILDLVYNPTGPFLPPSQTQLKADYKKELKDLFDIDFNSLYTITNMPIKRFLKDLEKSNKLEQYMQILVDHFNPRSVSHLMCSNLVSVAWNGDLFDCDFNQMLELPLGDKIKNIWQLDSFSEIGSQKITTEKHCFACTAGSGSSCSGALI